LLLLTLCEKRRARRSLSLAPAVPRPLGGASPAPRTRRSGARPSRAGGRVYTLFSSSSLVRTPAIHGLERTVDPREVLKDPACPFPRSSPLEVIGDASPGSGVMLRALRLSTVYLGRQTAEGALRAGKEDSHTRRETMTTQAPPNSPSKTSTAIGSAKKRRGQTRSRVRMRCWRRTEVNLILRLTKIYSAMPAVTLKAHSVFSVYHFIVRRMPASKVWAGRQPSVS